MDTCFRVSISVANESSWPSDVYWTPPSSFAFCQAERCVFCCPHNAFGRGLGGEYSSPSSSVFNAPYFSNCGTRTAWPTAANARAKERGRRGEEGRRTVVSVSLRRRHRRKLGVLVGAGVTCFDRLVHGIKLTSGSRERSLSCPARGRCRVLSSTGPGCCRAGVTPTHRHLLPVPQTRVFHCVDFSLIWSSSKGTGMNHATKRSRCTFLAYRRNPTSGPPSALIIPVFITASGHEHESS